MEHRIATLWREGWAAVAELSGSDTVAHRRANQLLELHGIANAIEGSKVYHVFVPNQRASEAIRLLHSDAGGREYSIKVLSSVASEDYIEYGP